MCNAWNHPPGCNCGWGGGYWGGGGGYAAPTQSTPTTRTTWTFVGHVSTSPTSFASYVNPNARCPVCGASVFFYQSSAGGRVFFDELGPPWPKHPCTDTQSFWSRSGVIHVGAHDGGRTPQWAEQGWSLFLCTKVLAVERNGVKYMIADGTLGKEHKRLCSSEAPFKPSRMYFVRAAQFGRWEVATLPDVTRDGQVVRRVYEAFDSLDLAVPTVGHRKSG